ncbi:MAG TPA: diacylglycerol kinase family protein [Vicinamibacterales bacterium]|nr:diacylglycerol kinase family protein [Vicinamibacterales bacterium]
MRSAAAIIINPISGGARPEQARRRAELASAVLTATGAEGEIFVTERKGHARELAAGAAARGDRLVIAWGGDGTVNEVASALAFTKTPLGIVPSGSGNGLARELAVSTRPERAIVQALEGTPGAIDMGELGGRTFVSVAGVGFDAHVAACFDRDLVGKRGFSGYVRITGRELMTYRPRSFRISGDVIANPRRALLVTLANSAQFGNGAKVAPNARVDDGRLDLVVFEESSRAATICALPRLFTGGAGKLRSVSIRPVKQIAIECDEPITFHVDGEPVEGGTRLDARIHPRALLVCVK